MYEPNPYGSRELPDCSEGLDKRNLRVKAALLVFLVVGIIVVVKLFRRESIRDLMAAAPVLMGVAGLNRDPVREQVKGSIEKAHVRGVRLGRPVIPVNSEEAFLLKEQGFSLPDIAAQLNCSCSTVKRRLKEPSFVGRRMLS